MTYGAREFLFLWSYALQNRLFWPEFLHESKYDPVKDAWVHPENRSIKVNREADVSVGILMARGVTRRFINERLKEIPENGRA